MKGQNRKTTPINTDNSLQKLLADLLDTLYYMQEFVAPELWNRYGELFGDLESKLAYKELELNKSDKGSNSSSHDITASLYRFASDLQEIESQVTTDAVAEISEIRKHRVSAKQPINSLFRDLVKILHPDVASDKNLTKYYWQKIKDAKDREDQNRIQTYHLILIGNADQSQESKLEELDRRIRFYKNKIDSLKRTEPFTLETNLSNRHWINGKRKILLNKILLLDIRIAQKQRLLDSISYKTKIS